MIITWLEIKEVCSKLTMLSVFGAMLYAILFFHNQNRTLKSSRESFRLANWKEIRILLEDDAKMRIRISSFLERLENDESLKMGALNSKYPTGKRVYLSNELEDFNVVARHYEYMGASIHLKYLPFDLIYEVVPFPDEFWEKTEKLRLYIKNNWFGNEKPLPDFLSNFEWLGKEFHKARKRSRISTKIGFFFKRFT